jgi:CubicO group peptidase (beta-lactamase class C family)
VNLGSAVALLVACLLVAAGEPSYAATNPASLEEFGDGAACCDPEKEGLDARKLVELTEWIRDRRIPVYSVLISRDGRLAYELYTSSLTRNHAHYQMSVTKSVVSALIGVAIDRGLISGPDAPVTDILPRVSGRSPFATCLACLHSMRRALPAR